MGSQKRFTYDCYTSSFISIPQVIQHMENIQNELQGTNLENLQYFNKTYLLISKEVSIQSKTQAFTFDTIMSTVDINFATYYFNALNSYVNRRKTTPAWQTAFDFYKKDISFPLIYLAHGVNAHVNNDLPFSLHEVVPNTDFKSDFDKVNAIIDKTIPEVLEMTNEKNYFQLIFSMMIRHWRKKAWTNYKKLERKKVTKMIIERNAQKIAQELVKIENKNDLYHVLKII